jgi:hypothetical protein
MATRPTAHNPYLASLDGLSIPSAVDAFFTFCREREAIRHRKDSGSPAPWSADTIFQRARFLNVFREDDRSTKSILRFVERAMAQKGRDDVPALLRAIFFARWCNRDATLDALTAQDLLDLNLRSALERVSSPPWDNVTAYPVGPVQWQGTAHFRLDTATALFSDIQCLSFLASAIKGSGRSVLAATAAINATFRMENDFPIFMAVMDVAWFRPDLIDPASPVPIGIGAVPFLDRLNAEMGGDLDDAQVGW